MSRLKRLTPNQVARFPEFVERWTKIGLSCEPLDLERAKAAVAKAYGAAKLAAPKIHVVCDGPVSAAIVAAIFKKSRVWASVRASVWDSVGDSVRDSVWDSVWDSVRASVWDSVGDSVRDSVGDSVRASVGDSVGDSVGASVRASVREQIYGAHEAGWLSFYAFFLEACRLDCARPLEGLIEIAVSCGWWAPYKNAAILQHRHCKLHRDERGRLHNPIGPAVKYRDGWGVYAWHGVRVPGAIIERPESITVGEIDDQPNAEVRRAMVEIYGQGRFIQDSGAKKLHVDDFGILYRRNMGDDEPLVLVKVVNSTPEPDGLMKDYFLRVPPEFGDGNHTARSAVAWTFDLQETDYAPAVET